SRMITYTRPPEEDESQDDEQDQDLPPDLADLMSLPDEPLSEVMENIRQADEELSKLLDENIDLKDSKGKEPDIKFPKRKKLDDSEGEEPDLNGTGPEAAKGNGQPEDELTEKELSHLKQLFAEGSLHGAMAVGALKKLPAKEGLCYRGMRMTQDAFRQRYEQPTIEPETLRQLTSVATERAAAQKFADGEGCRDPNKTVSVLTCIHVQTGR